MPATKGAKKHAGGRPPEYDAKRHPQLAAFMASRGATTMELADALDINERTVRRWFVSHPEFSEAFRFNASAFDERIERSLAESALGFEYEDTEVKVVNGEIHHVPVRRMFPPSLGAQKLYLSNRLPHKYRDQPEHKTVIELRSPEQIDREIKAKLLELYEDGYIDITPKDEATTSKRKSLVGDKRIRETGRQTGKGTDR